jgi:hypothetical protein
VTPGGHRRYSKCELKKLTNLSQKPLGVKDLVVTLEDTTNQHRQIALGNNLFPSSDIYISCLGVVGMPPAIPIT